MSETPLMSWASAISQTARVADASDELVAGLASLASPPDLLLLFVSSHLRARAEELVTSLRKRLQPGLLLGCTSAGVIGGGREAELQPAASVVAAVLPGVELTAFHVETDELPSPDAGPGAWIEALGVAPDPRPEFVVLCDPVTADPMRLLEGLDFAYQARTIGGLASDAPTNTLFVDERRYTSGVVGVALAGDVVMDPIVAQGCRPIGPPMRITRCRNNLLFELDGRPPTAALEEIYNELAGRDAKLLGRSLHVGIASTALLDPEREPEYLMRNLLGADPRAGVLAVGALLRQGQQVRFHVRDASAASAELDELLRDYQERPEAARARGALLFSCTGRGRHLYGEPDHDSQRFAEAVGDVPCGGFFCAGEIGPVGGGSALLGYTSSFGVFRPKHSDS